jgi:hypothetical protein
MAGWLATESVGATMTKNLRNASATVVSLWLALTSLGCGAGTSTDTSVRGSGNTDTSGSGGGSVIVPRLGSGGVGINTGVAGSSNSSVAASGGVSSGGVGDMQDAAGAGGVGNTVAAAGSGSPGGMRGGAGSRASGNAGGNALASGGTGGSATAGGPIWMPKPGVTWQWQLTGTLDTTVDAQMYDIDLFTNEASTMQTLHAAGRMVVCYFSAGSYEPDRPDSDALSKTGLGSVLDGWPDEKWLDVRSSAVRDIMKARLDLAKSKGCDGVEPDNVDGYDNSNGLGLTEADGTDYVRFLATEGHARGLSVGLKNSLGLVSAVVSSFDWALNEECLKYSECDGLAPFISAGKAVFHCEYGKTTDGICGKAPKGFSTIVKDLDLDAFRLACP